MNGQLPLALSIGGATFLLGVIWGGPFVEILRRLKIVKIVRPELQDTDHKKKEGTPTMGGIMIIVPVTLLTLALNISRIREDVGGSGILLPLFVLIGFALIGVIDDWESIQDARGNVGEGISGRLKISLQIILALVASIALSHLGFPYANAVTLPLFKVSLPLSPVVFVAVSAFVIVASSNATNLTDGMDGLAGIITSTAFAAYGVIAALQNQLFLAELCFIIIGACFAFLWYNAFPAQLFMGDTGALSLGALLGTVAVMSGQWLLLPVIAFVPVVEILSVVIQVASAKITRRLYGVDWRPLKFSPIHHHFQKVGWSEMRIVQRFWLVAILSAFLGVGLALI